MIQAQIMASSLMNWCLIVPNHLFIRLEGPNKSYTRLTKLTHPALQIGKLFKEIILIILY